MGGETGGGRGIGVFQFRRRGGEKDRGEEQRRKAGNRGEVVLGDAGSGSPGSWPGFQLVTNNYEKFDQMSASFNVAALLY